MKLLGNAITGISWFIQIDGASGWECAVQLDDFYHFWAIYIFQIECKSIMLQIACCVSSPLGLPDSGGVVPLLYCLDLMLSNGNPLYCIV